MIFKLDNETLVPLSSRPAGRVIVDPDGVVRTHSNEGSDMMPDVFVTAVVAGGSHFTLVDLVTSIQEWQTPREVTGRGQTQSPVGQIAVKFDEPYMPLYIAACMEGSTLSADLISVWNS